MEEIKKFIETYSSRFFRVGFLLIILSTLFLFTNLTTEFYDTPKFIILVLFAVVMTVALTMKFTASGRVFLVRTPLDIPLLILLAVAVVSTVLSPSPYVSLLGNQLKIHSSLISLIVYVLFYFLLINNLKSKREIKWFITLILFAAAVLSLMSLLAYFGVKILPSPFTHSPNFTPTGSTFSETAILAMLIPIVVTQILNIGSPALLILNCLFLLTFGTTIALTGNMATWIAAGIGLLLSFFVINPKLDFQKVKLINLSSLVVTVVLILLTGVLSYIPPQGRAQNPLYNLAKNFPREIQLDFVPSWKISVSAFRDHPFWGSGPSTFLFDFTTYKPIEFNSIKVWNLRFDAPFNEYLGVLATLGGVGLIALLSLTALFISSATKVFKQESGLETSLALSGIIFFVILTLHSSSLAVWVFGLIILAAFYVANLSSEHDHTSYVGNGVKQILERIAANVTSSKSFNETVKVDALPEILLIISLGLMLTISFFAGKLILADYHHRNALNAITKNSGILAYNELVAAEKLNPKNDLYRTDLAQTNFALASAIAQAKAPTEASPGGSLTDQDKQNIQVLLQQSINEGRIATTLSPKSAVNWEILGLLYRQISGVAQNALVFSLDSYGRSIFQDPLNPQLRLNVGGIYYSIKNYDLAIRFFTDSINLKPDFTNGYYNLSVALRDKGDLNAALQAAQKVQTLVDPASPDYKVATDYLNDLKNKVSPPTPPQPPAAQENGALQQKELPKVVNVGNPPEKIATPEAVKKPNSTPVPTTTPNP